MPMFLLVLSLACTHPSSTVRDSGATAADDTGTTVPDGGVSTDGGDTGTLSVTVAVDAVEGELGGAVVVTDLKGLTMDQIRIQVERDHKWLDVCTGTDRCLTLPDARAVRAISQDGQHVSAEVVPTPVDLVVSSRREDQGYWTDERIELDRNATPSFDGLQTVLSRTNASGDVSWWGLDGAWMGQPVDLGTSGVLVPISAAMSPGWSTFTLQATLPTDGWVMETGAPDDDPFVLAATSLEIVELGRKVLWGDPHIHTDMSFDGCEAPARGCQGPDKTPADNVYAQAKDAGLDFAAITDHAEWTQYKGSESAPVIDIWDREQQLVSDAEGTGIIPILGYEWTRASEDFSDDGYRLGGHRTVLLEDSTACDEWHIGSTGIDKVQSKGWGTTQVRTLNSVLAISIEDLRTSLATAAADCGSQRAVVFGHHPAILRPQPIEWANPANAPDPTYESLVQIVSEHGTAECIDLDASWCDWRVDDSRYFSDGSYQAALQQGYLLGVLGGTDAHDGMGLDSDGASCTAITLDDGTLACQVFNGGASGILTAAPYDRTALFDAMYSRYTMATSGPLVPVRGWATRTDDSHVYLPGTKLPDDTTSATLTISLVGAYSTDDFPTVAIDVLDQTGTILSTVDDAFLQVPVSASPGDAVYVRVRMYPDGDDEGERLWLSPWFFPADSTKG